MNQFLKNIARRAEPVYDLRPRMASRFEGDVTDNSAIDVESETPATQAAPPAEGPQVPMASQSVAATPDTAVTPRPVNNVSPSIESPPIPQQSVQPSEALSEAPGVLSALQPVDFTNSQPKRPTVQQPAVVPMPVSKTVREPITTEHIHEMVRVTNNTVRHEYLVGDQQFAAPEFQPNEQDQDDHSATLLLDELKFKIDQLRQSQTPAVETIQRNSTIQRVVVEQPAANRPLSSPSGPQVNVKIGRIEVQARSATSPPSAARSRALTESRIMSLDEYLAKRSSGGIT